jgi:uncharacterized DUF497 family protein
MNLRFGWDEKKNLANYRKHRVWFEEAQTVWADPLSAEFFDPEHSEAEERFLRIGHSSNGKLLLVVFCDREAGELIRLISARKATVNEGKTYEEGIRSEEAQTPARNAKVRSGGIPGSD